MKQYLLNLSFLIRNSWNRPFIKIAAVFAFSSLYSCFGPSSDYPPAIEITSIEYVTHNTAIIRAAVIEEHRFYVEKGVVYSLSPEPTIEDMFPEHHETGDTIRLPLSGLEPNTAYYLRPYTKNIDGITYGEEQSFTTKQVNIFTDVRDGNTYTEIDIFDKVWMGENMRYEIEGFSLPVKDGHTLVDDARLGLLYSIEVCEDVCPSGWHLPTDEEWKTFESALSLTPGLPDSDTLPGAYANTIREPGIKHWRSDNESITNFYGFTALPAGLCDANGYNEGYGNYGYFWTAPEDDSVYYNRVISNQNNENPQILRSYLYSSSNNINYYISVRCVKDTP